MAQNLTAFTQGLALDGDLARAEPKRLRYALLRVAGRFTTSRRTTTMRLLRERPWSQQLADAFDALRSLSFVT